MRKIVLLLLLLAGILPFACTKSLAPDHLSSDASPAVQKKYLVSLQGSVYSAYFQYTDSAQTSYLEFNQTNYISSYFMYYAGTRLQSISSGTDNVLKREINTSNLSDTASVLIETDTNAYTYGSDGLPVTVTETQVNKVTGTMVYSFSYGYAVR